jgi:hypothetical protein
MGMKDDPGCSGKEIIPVSTGNQSTVSPFGHAL